MKELVNLRKEKEKHYLNDDGTITAYLYDEAIHYLDKETYEEIDNTIIEKEKYYMNHKNDFQVEFYKEHFLVSVSTNKYYMNILLENSNKLQRVETKGNKITFKEIIKDVDLEYEIIGRKLKETFKLNQKGLKNVTFKINTNLELEKSDQEIIAKKDGVEHYRFDAPFLKDAKNNYFYNCEISLEKKDNCYILTYLLDEDWLEEAVYPVIIDPTITNKRNTVTDTYIYLSANGKDTTETRHTKPFIKVGVGDNTVYRSLVKFELPHIGTSAQVIHAEAYFSSHGDDRYLLGEEYTSMDKIATLHRMTKDWDEATANWDNLAEDYDPFVENYMTLSRTEVRPYPENKLILSIMPFDITNIVKKWYSGTPNYGLMMKWYEEVYDANCKEYTLYSSNNTESVEGSNPRPLLMIQYRYQNGILDYMSYQTTSLSTVNSSINNYNGNVTNVIPINQLAGSDLALNLIYNTSSVLLNEDFKIAKGWKLNYDEYVAKEIIDDIIYYKYVGGTGTIHYFYEKTFENKEKVWIDEDGLGLSLDIEKNDDGTIERFIIISKTGIKSTYLKENNYYLSRIDYVDNSYLQLVRDASNRIISVKDEKDNIISISYASNGIQFTSDSETTSITIENNLIKTIHLNIGDISINYNTNDIITKIIDVTGISLSYEYYDGIPYRLKKITNIGLNDEIGKFKTFEYHFNSTTVTDNKNNKMRYTFNNLGNTIGTVLLSKDGTLKNSFGFSDQYVDELKLPESNKPFATSVPIKYIEETETIEYGKENLMPNGDFESDETNIFTSYGNEITNETSYTGCHSIKLNSGSVGSMLLETGPHLLTAYFKNEKPITLEMQASGTSSPIFYNPITIPAHQEFTKVEIPLKVYESYESVEFYFTVEDNEIAYVDHVSLYKGEYVNLVKNSSFNNLDEMTGLIDWTVVGSNNDTGEELSDCYDIVTLDSYEKALKLKSVLNGSVVAYQSVPITGKKGDVYTLSFWYKNEGVLDPGMMADFFGNFAQLEFVSPNDEEFGHGTDNIILNYHADEWQYFSQTYVALNDYESIFLTIISSMEANNLYVTNFSLIKNLGSYFYEYDEFGNIISTYDITNQTNQFKYDQNNQLIASFNPKGNHFYYEYDNVITDRLLRGTSPTGITNEIKYDTFGNPIKTIIKSTNPQGKEINGDYYIRLKGTNKYVTVNPIDKSLKSSEDTCNHYAFTFTNTNNLYVIRPTILSNYSLHTADNTVHCSKGTPSNFTLEHKENGSYYIKVANLYLKEENNNIVLSSLVENDVHYEFYLEDIHSKEYIEENAHYTEDGRFIKETIDALGEKTVYDIDPNTGLISTITNANNQTTSYTYNQKKELTKVETDDKIIEYNYDNRMLKSIQSGNKAFTFDYDNFQKTNSVKINNQSLITNEYEENDGKLKKSTYGNGATVEYTYDDFDRMNTVKKGNKTYSYHYNYQGLMDSIYNETSQALKFQYDYAQRVANIIIDNDLSIEYEYDVNSNVSKEKQVFKSMEHTIEYTYNEDDSIIKLKVDNQEINYEYDAIGRLKVRTINGELPVEYTYKRVGNKTSLIIDKIKIGEDIYQFTYDNLYNITKITKNEEVVNEYIYDNRNQLISDNNYEINRNYIYTYNEEGNISKREIKDIETNTTISRDTFEYTNTLWEDQLTKVNEETIKYDAIGNPLTIGNKVLTWNNGRELTSYQDHNLEVDYTYNVAGLRTEKKVNGVKTKYYLEDEDILVEEREGDVLYYIRDDSGELVGVMRNGEIYYYQKNYQGDITGIYDSSYKLIVKYRYDAYGNVLSIEDNEGKEITDTNHIGRVNPYRYRSYYYDEETNLYYLKSRYYNPLWGRFINADNFIETYTVFGLNLYCYVGNNPVSRYDENGKFWKAVGSFLKNAWDKTVEFGKQVFSSIKKETSKAISGIKNTVKKGFEVLKKSFVFEVGTGSGFSYEEKDSVIHVVDRIDVTSKYKNGKYEEFLEEKHSLGIYMVDFDLKENQIDSISIGADQISVSFEKNNTTIFMGFSKSLHIGVGGHIKIGFEIDWGD